MLVRFTLETVINFWNRSAAVFITNYTGWVCNTPKRYIMKLDGIYAIVCGLCMLYKLTIGFSKIEMPFG